MKIGTSTSCVTSKIGDEAGIKKFAAAGFDCLDLSLFIHPIRGELFTGSDRKFEEYFRNIKKAADESGIYIEQTHSPMPSYTGNKEEDDYLFEIQAKSIKAASYLGSKYIIIHPMIPSEYRYDHYRAETKELNMKFYNGLLPYLKEYNVKLGIENMFNWDPERKCICPTVCSTPEEMLDYINTLNDEHFVACLDTGHALLTGNTPGNMVRVLGDKLETLHVHDNDGIDDRHVAPYMGKIDWDDFAAALKEVNYKGVFNFESDMFYHMFYNNIDDSMKFLRSIGKQISSKVYGD